MDWIYHTIQSPLEQAVSAILTEAARDHGGSKGPGSALASGKRACQRRSKVGGVSVRKITVAGKKITFVSASDLYYVAMAAIQTALYLSDHRAFGFSGAAGESQGFWAEASTLVRLMQRDTKWIEQWEKPEACRAALLGLLGRITAVRLTVAGKAQAREPPPKLYRMPSKATSSVKRRERSRKALQPGKRTAAVKSGRRRKG